MLDESWADASGKADRSGRFFFEHMDGSEDLTGER